MRLRVMLLAGMAGLCAAGCASSKRAASDVPEPGEPYWSGSLQSVQQRSGGLVVTGQSRAYGSVNISRAEGNLRRMRVRLVVNATTSSGTTQFRWAVLPDRCGAGTLPLIGFEQFPLIDIGTNGRGEITADLPLELEPNSAYHVNVYSSGQQLDNVITCANLKYETSG